MRCDDYPWIYADAEAITWPAFNQFNVIFSALELRLPHTGVTIHRIRWDLAFHGTLMKHYIYQSVQRLKASILPAGKSTSNIPAFWQLWTSTTHTSSAKYLNDDHALILHLRILQGSADTLIRSHKAGRIWHISVGERHLISQTTKLVATFSKHTLPSNNRHSRQLFLDFCGVCYMPFHAEVKPRFPANVMHPCLTHPVALITQYYTVGHKKVPLLFLR